MSKYGTEIQDVIQQHIFEAIAKERERQAELWGPQTHIPDRWLTILGEEYGEACEGLLKEDEANYRDELIQVAAVAVAAITNLAGRWHDPNFVVDALAPPGSRSE